MHEQCSQLSEPIYRFLQNNQVAGKPPIWTCMDCSKSQPTSTSNEHSLPENSPMHDDRLVLNLMTCTMCSHVSRQKSIGYICRNWNEWKSLFCKEVHYKLLYTVICKWTLHNCFPLSDGPFLLCCVYRVQFSLEPPELAHTSPVGPTQHNNGGRMQKSRRARFEYHQPTVQGCWLCWIFAITPGEQWPLRDFSMLMSMNNFIN